MRKFYGKLEGKRVVTLDSVYDWALWFDSADRIVGKDVFGDVQISTVFLGMNHAKGLSRKVRDLWFETLIFGGKHDGYIKRYSTWNEAEAGHAEAVTLVKIEKRKEKSLVKKFVLRLFFTAVTYCLFGKKLIKILIDWMPVR